MKHILIFPSLILLAACSSTGDANRIGGGYTNNEYQQMRASNMQVSSLPQNVTNRMEIVEYAKSVGVVFDSGVAGANVDSSRYASTPGTVKPGHSNVSSDRDKVPVFNKQYTDAINAFTNMYEIYLNGFKNLDLLAVRSAYMIAGGDASQYTWDSSLSDDDKSEIRDFISSNALDILDRYFAVDPENPGKYIIEAQSQDLSDIELNMPSGTDKITFNLDEHGEIIGVAIGDSEFSRRNSTGRQFTNTNKTAEYTDKTIASVITRGEKYGLKYSDFGYININTTRDFADKTLLQQTVESSIKPYAGGYALKNISREKLSDQMRFNGTAVGSVSKTDTDAMLISGNATLNFQDGVETLNMFFASGATDVTKKWYDVEIVNDGTDATITFTPNDIVKPEYQLSQTGTISDYTGVDIKYYGDNNVVSEFSGTATFTDTAVENGVTMNAAFGGSKN